MSNYLNKHGVRKRLLMGLSSSIVVLSITACGGGNSSVNVVPVAGSNTVAINTVAADFSGSDVQLLSLDEDYTLSAGLVPSDQSDIGTARYNGSFYQVGRFNIDTVAKYNFAAPSTTVYEYSTLNSPEDPTGNPASMVFVSESKAYLTLKKSGKVLIVNPSAQTEAGFIIGELGLSAYADADANGSPEPSAAAIVDGKLFVVMQRLVSFSPAEEGVNAYIAVFDTNNDTEIDTNPNDDAANLKGIELSTRNPGKLDYRAGVGLFLQANGDSFWSFRGRDESLSYTGGITKINTDDYSIDLILDDGDGDNHPYGYIFNITVIDASNVYFVGYQSYQNYNLYHFNPASGQVRAIDAYTGLDISVLGTGPLGNLWMGISDSAQPRIEILDSDENVVQMIGLIQNPGNILFPGTN